MLRLLRPSRQVDALLEEGASPNAQLTEKLGEEWWSETPALYIACDKKIENVVELSVALVFVQSLTKNPHRAGSGN